MRYSLPGDEGNWQEGPLMLQDGVFFFASRAGRKSRKRSPIHGLIGNLINALFGGSSGRSTTKGFAIPLRNIRDVIREDTSTIAIKHSSNPSSTGPEPGSDAEQLLSTLLSADEPVLNDVERELIMGMNAYQFNVYFTHAGEGGVLSMEKNVELEKGLLKISDLALWIIGRDVHQRIAWSNIVNVEQKKRSLYKGTEYSAISIDYFGEDSMDVTSSIIITRGNTVDVLKRHVMELLRAYKQEEKLSDSENQIVTMLYAGALDLSESAFAATADAFGMSEGDLKTMLEHLKEQDIVDSKNQALTRKGIKYVVDLSKNGTFGG
ncbi:MAG: hypothetical protein WAV32_09575 [Halobacteriota archaeon]